MPNKPQLVMAVKTMVLRHRRTLIVKRSINDHFAPGEWEFPGGKMEFGERPAEAAARELAEETGLSARYGPVLYTDTAHILKRRQVVVVLFLATANEGRVTLSNEHDDYLWATRGDLDDLLRPHEMAALVAHGVLERTDLAELD